MIPDPLSAFARALFERGDRSRTGLPRAGLFVLCLGTLAAVAGCGSPTPADKYAADSAALSRGKSIFIGTCAGYCHLTSPGPRDAPYLFDCIWKNNDGSDEQIFATISNGVPNTTMVGFAGSLPEGDADIWRVVAYLKSARVAC